VQRPSGTRAWLSQRNIQTHHHLRLGVAGDFARLARRLTGRAVGLVMSGGGARGLAHIGAMRAFEEAGLRPDFVGGTSAGAVSAATYVTEYSYEQMLALARTWSARGKMLDYTLPITSLIATRKFTDLFRTMFGEVEIEDLWQRFFCISSNLTHAEPVIHTDGPLWAAVRASTAIPAVMAPLLDSNGDVLVDGGVMNNFPIDVMREVFAAGIVIGVDVAPPDDDVRRYSFGPSVSGWQLLWSKLVWRKAPLSAPSILEALFRTIEINGAYRLKSPAFRSSADLLIHVPLKQYGMFDFDMYPELIERGYQTVKQQLGAWNQHAAVMRWYGAP
jgi:predicted acylesterase/phospholipase RssA